MKILENLVKKVPLSVPARETLALTAFGLTKIRAILFASPKILRLDDEVVQVKIPLNWRTRNHLNCMYFGILVTGADVAGGILAMNLIKASGRNIALLFKDLSAEFLKRAEADTVFKSSDGKKLKALVDQAIQTGERVEDSVEVIATVPSKLGDEPVARFKLTISLKDKSKP